MKHPVYVVTLEVNRLSTGLHHSVILDATGSPEEAEQLCHDHIDATLTSNLMSEFTIVWGQAQHPKGLVRSTYAEIEMSEGANVVSTFTYVISKFSIEINEDE